METKVDSSVLISVLTSVVFVAVLFLLFRKVVCWYWKINQGIGLLEDILKELKAKSDKKE